MGIDVIIEQLDELVPLGLSSVLLFPVLDASGKEKVIFILIAVDFYIHNKRFKVNFILPIKLMNFRTILEVWLLIPLQIQFSEQ